MERRIVINKRWRNKNPKKLLEYNRNWRKKNPERAAHLHIKSEIKREVYLYTKIKGTITDFIPEQRNDYEEQMRAWARNYKGMAETLLKS